MPSSRIPTTIGCQEFLPVAADSPLWAPDCFNRLLQRWMERSGPKLKIFAPVHRSARSHLKNSAPHSARRTWPTLAPPRQERYIIDQVSARCIHRNLSSGT